MFCPKCGGGGCSGGHTNYTMRGNKEGVIWDFFCDADRHHHFEIKELEPYRIENVLRIMDIELVAQWKLKLYDDRHDNYNQDDYQRYEDFRKLYAPLRFPPDGYGK